jgi:hypothetical protein
MTPIDQQTIQGGSRTRWASCAGRRPGRGWDADAQAHDAEARRRLCALSEQLTGLAQAA